MSVALNQNYGLDKPVITDGEIQALGLEREKDNRLFFYLYTNKDSKFNVVRPEDLINHIEYNRIFRPGRLMYIEDSEKGFVRLNDGIMSKDKLAEYDQLAREFFETRGKKISRVTDTRPYC